MLILGIIVAAHTGALLSIKVWIIALLTAFAGALIFKDKITQTTLIFLTCFFLGGSRMSMMSAEDDSVRTFGNTPLERSEIAALQFRDRMMSHFRGNATDQPTAVIAAMTLGDKSYISQTTKEEYSVAGASHILALSGLHLGIIFCILSLLTGGRNHLFLSNILSLTAIWCYVVLVGMSPSVVRSATMITILAFTQMLRRRLMSLNSISLAAFIMLLVRPMNLYDVGFEMSFLSVLSIFIFFQPIYGLVDAKFLQNHRVVKWVWGMAVISLSAQLFTIPVVAYYFHRVSCYSVFTSFIVIPAATVILYLTLLMFVTVPFSSVSSFLAYLLSVAGKWLNIFVGWSSRLPGASIEDIHISILQLVMIYISIACLYLLGHYFTSMKPHYHDITGHIVQ